MAGDVAGMGPVFRGWVKQAATAASWSCAKLAIFLVVTCEGDSCSVDSHRRGGAAKMLADHPGLGRLGAAPCVGRVSAVSVAVCILVCRQVLQALEDARVPDPHVGAEVLDVWGARSLLRSKSSFCRC